MTDEAAVGDSAEELYEDAPCGYLSTRPDGTIVRVNRTFEAWTGHAREALVGTRRFQDLLAPGGRIYHETHLAPLLQMQGAVREIAVEVVRADGTRLPALVNAVLHRDDEGRPQRVRMTVFDATDRRRYEQELLRARRRERDIALELQRSLLAGAVPAADGLEVAVAYRPADGLEAGGDWYDAFWLEPGDRVAVVVGDVVGRGIGAAAGMGQLRSAVRALASTGLRPGALLDAMDGYVRRHGVGEMATVVYAELDLATAQLRYACAGHPPPVVAEPGEEAVLATEGRSLPLGAFTADARPRRDARRALPPGATVLLYTDGLVERRGLPVGDGIERLRRAVASRAGTGPAALTSALAATLHDPGEADDVCLLAVRVGAAA